MQNKHAASQYIQRGYQKKTNRGLVRKIIKAFFVLLILSGVIFGIVKVAGLFGVNRNAILLSGTPQMTYQNMGKRIIYYDGTSLHCLNTDGEEEWFYQVGLNASFNCSDNAIIAWTANQVYVINSKGQGTFVDRMNDTVRFAEIGESFIAVCTGNEYNSEISIFRHDGTPVENLQEPDVYVMDMGFFDAEGKYIWVDTLDVGGKTPTSRITVYLPGNQLTGAVELNDTMVYHVYEHGGNLMVCDLNRISAYSYKCVKQETNEDIISYGWQVRDTRTSGKNTYALLLPSGTGIGSSSKFSEVCLTTNYSRQSLRMLTECADAVLGSKGVYGFGDYVLYRVPYGETVPKTYPLNFSVSRVLCVVNGTHAVVESDGSVYLYELPD